jgi:hypothetical protein
MLDQYNSPNELKVYSINKSAKQAIENFITNPCEETLKPLLLNKECLLEFVVPGIRMEREKSQLRRCPFQCERLSLKRYIATGHYSCIPSYVQLAWKECPAALVLTLIEFNAYIESCYRSS